MQILRRRGMMKMGKEDPYKDWVKASVRNYNGETRVINCNISFVSRMMVDGVEITPSLRVNFGDNDYHVVYYLFKDLTTLPSGAFFIGNYLFRAVDMPASFVTFDPYSLRNLAAAARADLALRAESYPTFEQYSLLGSTLLHMYVPSSVYNDYITAAPIATSRIHLLDDYTWKL